MAKQVEKNGSSKEDKTAKISKEIESLPPNLTETVETLTKKAQEMKDDFQIVISLQKIPTFIERAKQLLIHRADISKFSKHINDVKKYVGKIESLGPILVNLEKKKGDFIIIRRLMDILRHKTDAERLSLKQIESLLTFTLIFCFTDNPHIKYVLTAHHLFKLLLQKRISTIERLRDIYKELEGSGNQEHRGKLKTWIKAEESTIKKFKELVAKIKVDRHGDILDTEISDQEKVMILESRYLSPSQCSPKIKNAQLKNYMIISNMLAIPSLIEHVREQTIMTMGGKEKLASVHDLALISIMVRSYVQEISRLQGYLSISPKDAKKKIMECLREAHPYIFTGFKRVSNNPKDYFELNLLDNIGYYLIYFVMLVGGIFKSNQITEGNTKMLIDGVVSKLQSENGNKSIGEMLQNNYGKTVEDLQLDKEKKAVRAAPMPK